MTALTICVLLSSLSFFAYVFSYFTNPWMKSEFKRFGIAKLGLMTIILQLLGATGLLVGLKLHFILGLASLGLALLMFAGVLVRIKMNDGLWLTLPALFYMVLNGYIFYAALELI